MVVSKNDLPDGPRQETRNKVSLILNYLETDVDKDGLKVKLKTLSSEPLLDLVKNKLFSEYGLENLTETDISNILDDNASHMGSTHAQLMFWFK